MTWSWHARSASRRRDAGSAGTYSCHPPRWRLYTSPPARRIWFVARRSTAALWRGSLSVASLSAWLKSWGFAYASRSTGFCPKTDSGCSLVASARAAAATPSLRSYRLSVAGS